MRFDQNQGLLRPDPRQRAIRNPLSTFHLKDGLVASGTLEELVQYLITGYGEQHPLDCELRVRLIIHKASEDTTVIVIPS